MEEKYWELRENFDRTFDKWFASREDWDYIEYAVAKNQYMNFCMEVLEKIMEKNSDVLARLK